MAAGEDQLQALVGKRRWSIAFSEVCVLLEQVWPWPRGCWVAANAVEGSVAGGRDQPGPGVGGEAVARPALGGNGEGLLGGFLGEVEVAEEADQGGDHAAPLVAERLLEDGYHSMIGRTSMAPPSRAAGILAANSMRGVQVVGLVDQVAVEGFLGLDEGPVGRDRLAVLHSDGGRRLGRLEALAGRDARASR